MMRLKISDNICFYYYFIIGNWCRIFKHFDRFMIEVDGMVNTCSSATACQTQPAFFIKHERLVSKSDGNSVNHSQLLDRRETVTSDLQLTKRTIKTTITSLQFPH